MPVLSWPLSCQCSVGRCALFGAAVIVLMEREPDKWLPHLRKAAGAQITQSWHREVVARNNNTGHPCFVIGMDRC